MALKPATRAPRAAPDPDALELGETIRRMRADAGLTLDQVAGAAGVSRSLVSQVERGIASPSITTLRGIASALGVPVAALFLGADPPAGGSDADSDRTGRRLVVRHADRKPIKVRHSGVVYELLTPDVKRDVEFLFGEFAPGATAPPEEDTWAAHEGEENVVILEGEVVFIIGGKEYALGEGDSISFDCSVPHRGENRSDLPCRMIVAITPPSF